MSSRTNHIVLTSIFALLGALLLLIHLRMQPPTPMSANQATGQFSAYRAYQTLREILAEELPHPVDSTYNKQVRDRIKARLDSLGYDTQIQTSFSCHEQAGKFAGCATVNNILAVLPGQANNPAVLVLAHYDSVPAGPGIADNGAGVAAALEIAEIIRVEGPFRNPVRFVFTDGEESGLLGARAFIKEHPWADQIGVVINMEARGTEGQSLLFETSNNNAWLIDSYASSVKYPATNSLMYDIYRLLPNDTDLTVFKEAGIQGLNFAFIERSRAYHTALDNLVNLDLGSLQHHGDNILPMLRRFASMHLSSPPTGNATYIDLLGFFVIRWPAQWTFALAVLAAMLLFLECHLLMLRRRLRMGQLAWGALAAMTTIISPIIPGMMLVSLVEYITGEATAGVAYPLALRISLWSLALLCGMLSSQLFYCKAGFLGLAMGVWLLWSLIALPLSALLPGASVVFLLPTLIASCLIGIGLLWSWRVSETRTLPLNLNFLCAGFFSAMIWLRLALQLETALGFAMNFIITCAVALLVSTLAPFLVSSENQTPRRNGWLMSTAAIAFLSVLTSLFLPVYTVATPQPLNVLFVQDSDKNTAYLLGFPNGNLIPDVSQPSNDLQSRMVFPWDENLFLASNTNLSNEAPPDLEILSDQIINGKRQVTAKMHTKRSADQIRVYLPVNGLRSIEVFDRTFLMTANTDNSGMFRFMCYGLSCDGLKMIFHLEPAKSYTAYVIDISYHLPVNFKALRQSNTSTRIAIGNGDQTWVFHRVILD